MSSDRDLVAQIFAELARLGLRLDESPYQAFAAGPGGAAQLLDKLRGLQTGVTWRDVFPDMPASSMLGDPETWTTPYRPLGPFDYPTLPTGPAVHVHWPAGADTSPLAEFVATARAAGWPVYGAGLVQQLRDRSREFDAHIVLDRDTSEDRFDEFLAWIDEQADVEIAIVTRPVGEKHR